jgi:spore germination protein YaaH
MNYLRIITIVICLIGIGFGFAITRTVSLDQSLLSPLGIQSPFSQPNQVIGFLPYWLLSTANEDYSQFITTLTYFGLTIGPDGHIITKTNKTESEPGWYALKSGKYDRFLASAKTKQLTNSLLVFAGTEDSIYQIISDPQTHASNLVTDVIPLMQQHGFTDLNLDIESIATASESAQQSFTQFIKTVSKQIKTQTNYTLTLEITAADSIKHKLIDVQAVTPYVDHIVMMAYDYHYMGSQVSGPIAPIQGGGTTYEYDVTTAIEQALRYIPSKKLILGIPVYGYEWETMLPATSSATLPGSGITASTKRIKQLVSNCTTCTITVDEVTKENTLIYQNTDTFLYHQINYPTQESTSQKTKIAKKYNIGGIAVWALGYEDDSILNPLTTYRP